MISLFAAESNTGGGVGVLLIYGAIFGGMYMLLIRPQRRRTREAKELQASIQVGDEVVLNSGIYGFVSAIEDDIMWVDIADGHGSERIEVRVKRGAVASKTTTSSGSTDAGK